MKIDLGIIDYLNKAITRKDIIYFVLIYYLIKLVERII
jgi:hypothetical protein